MIKISAFEGFMLLAVALLLTGFVWPRAAQNSQEVLAAKAQLLEMQLQSAYDHWRLNGGVHGQGDPSSPEVLTTNLLECLTSEVGSNYCSKKLGNSSGRLVLGKSGVYESPKLYPRPAEVRASSISSLGSLRSVITKSGVSKKGVLINDRYAACFSQNRWEVVALQ